MPSSCIVPLCSSRDAGHRFPKDPELKKKWLFAIRRDKFDPNKYSRICKKHFVKSDFVLPLESVRENPLPRLRKGAVPSQFQWTKIPKKAVLERNDRARRRLNLKGSLVRKPLISQENTLFEERPILLSCDDIDSEVTVENPTKDIGVQCDNIISVKCDVSTNTCITNNSAFRIEFFKAESKNSELKFYTGFEDYKHFWLVFSVLGPAVNHLVYYPQASKQELPDRAVHIMTPANEFFLTIIKLRRNMLNKELSFKFNISQSHVSRIFITWINFLYCQLKELNIWVPRQIAEKHLKCKGLNCSSTVIIDCTEIKIEKPTNPVAQQQTYSTYKSCNTLKILVGMSSTGSVTFVSDAYGGSISDRALFEKCGLKKLLIKDDIVLADRGFQIQDLLAHKDVVVNIPEFLKKQCGQLEREQINKSKKTSSNRIHIERIIGMAKTYKIVHGTLSYNLVPLASRIVFTCFMLVNLRPNIMEKKNN